MKILVVNAGSSTHKCALFEKGEKIPLWTGFLDWGVSPGQVFMKYRQKNGETVEKILPYQPADEMIEMLLKSAGNLSDIQMIGHRVVHGGEKFEKPTLITPEVKKTIKDLIQLAPLHNPANLEGILVMEKLFPKLPQVAVFDTAFHSHIPDVASTYALPYEFKKEGIKRYGFHGISHEYCMKRTFEMIQGDKSLKMITCHLGNGASLAAIDHGQCIDTTMGFTPLEGLMMGSRCGSIDPGILLYLIKQKKMSGEEVDRLLNFESGMKGINTKTSDMREIIKRMNEGDSLAKLCFEMFVYRLNGFIGKLTANLQGLNVLVFTAGIGENCAPLRLASCKALEFLGVIIDPKKNESCFKDGEISAPHSKVRVFVIKTEEEYEIAEECMKLSLFS